ncbi:hypothetical protein V1478_018776 [Vespula squamosa]|uniref:Uncharacterized protein n=1 Tax=Vespula squamosa TaxID=30214 RepID=A0ABD1ZW77_VESSQ
MLVTVALPSSTEGTYLLKHSQQASTDTSSLATSNFLAEQKRGCGKAFVDLRGAEIASRHRSCLLGVRDDLYCITPCNVFPISSWSRYTRI